MIPKYVGIELRFGKQNKSNLNLLYMFVGIPLDSLRPFGRRNLCKYGGTMAKSSGDCSLVASVELGTSEIIIGHTIIYTEIL